MQLAQQIDVSQQAIMKHLNILEKADFVSKKKVASDAGGPPKNIYMVEKSISFVLIWVLIYSGVRRKLPKAGQCASHHVKLQPQHQLRRP